MKLLKFIRSLGKPAQLTIESYGQASSGLDSEKIQAIMEWLTFLVWLSFWGCYLGIG